MSQRIVIVLECRQCPSDSSVNQMSLLFYAGRSSYGSLFNCWRNTHPIFPCKHVSSDNQHGKSTQVDSFAIPSSISRQDKTWVCSRAASARIQYSVQGRARVKLSRLSLPKTVWPFRRSPRNKIDILKHAFRVRLPSFPDLCGRTESGSLTGKRLTGIPPNRSGFTCPTAFVHGPMTCFFCGTREFGQVIKSPDALVVETLSTFVSRVRVSTLFHTYQDSSNHHTGVDHFSIP